MISPGMYGWTVFRWQPAKLTVDFVGYDFTGATFKSEVRAYRDAPDSALISLANAASPTQGISVSVVTTDGVPTSTVEIRIDEATIEGLPFTNPRGTDWQAVWDLVITPSGGTKARWLEGTFTVRGGATQV